MSRDNQTTYPITLTVGTTTLDATLEDNATTRALLSQMPFTITMDNLYGREMCYRYGAGSLSTSTLRSDGYTIGDIAYWPPRGSLVILYAQNGKQFERQQVGHIDADASTLEALFSEAGATAITFARADGR